MAKQHVSKQGLYMDSGPKIWGCPLFIWVSIVNKDLKSSSELLEDPEPKYLATNDEDSRPQMKWDKATQRETGK